jgi:hypothetical protein
MRCGKIQSLQIDGVECGEKKFTNLPRQGKEQTFNRDSAAERVGEKLRSRYEITWPFSLFRYGSLYPSRGY